MQRLIKSGAANAKELQDRLEATRHIYDISKKRLSGEDKEWEERKQYLLTEMSLIVNSYDGENGFKASYILGKIQKILAEIDQPRLTVAEWDQWYSTMQRMSANPQ